MLILLGVSLSLRMSFEVSIPRYFYILRGENTNNFKVSSEKLSLKKVKAFFVSFT